MLKFETLKSENGFVIGETACGHDGELSKLKKLIDCVADSGAQAIKFQIFIPLERATPDHHEWEIFNKLTLEENQWRDAVEYARGKKLVIFADVFGDDGFSIAKKLNLDGFKVHSEDLLNSRFIASVAAEDKVVMIGVGGAHRVEIYNLLNFLKNKSLLNKVILVTGVQTFPTPIEAHSLDEVSDLASKYASFGVKVGFSDHVSGDLVEEATIMPLMALAKGAVILEKHVTINRSEKWEDYESALDKSSFKRFVELVKTLSPLLTSTGNLNSYELQYRKTFKKSPVARKNLKAQEVLDSSVIDFVKHPSESIPVSGLNLFGKNLVEPLKKGEIIRMSNIYNEVGAIIVARCTSTRLPNKATRKILDKETIVLLIERIKRCNNVDKIILATSTDSSDDVLEDIAKREGILFFRGSLDDLSSRFYEAAKNFKVNHIVRITGDDILRDEFMIDKAVESHLKSSCDVTFTSNMPYGTSSEVFTFNALETILNTAVVPEYTEYLEWYLENDRYFSVNRVESSYNFDSRIRLTLDYEEDFEFFDRIFHDLYPSNPGFTLQDTLTYLSDNPEIISINDNKRAKFTNKDIDVSLAI